MPDLIPQLPDRIVDPFAVGVPEIPAVSSSFSTPVPRPPELQEGIVDPFSAPSVKSEGIVDPFAVPPALGVSLTDPFAIEPEVNLPAPGLFPLSDVGEGSPPAIRDLRTRVPLSRQLSESVVQSTRQSVGGLMQLLGSPEGRAGVIGSGADIAINPVGSAVGAFLRKAQKDFPGTITDELVSAFTPMKSLLGVVSKELGPTEFEQNLKGAGEALSKDARRKLGKVLKNQDFVEQVATTVVTSFSRAAPGILARNPWLMLGAFGADEMGRSFDEGKAGGLTDEEAGEFALAKTTLELGTELIPAKILIQRAPFRKKLMRFLGAEMLGENVAEFGQLYVDFVAGLRDDVTWPELLHTFALVNTSTVLGAGLQIGAVKVLEATGDVIEARRDASRLQEISDKHGIPVDDITGPFTPLPEEYIDLQQRVSETDTALRELSQEVVKSSELVDYLSGKAVKSLGGSTYRSAVAAERVNSELAVVYKDGTTDIAAAMKPGDVVRTAPKAYGSFLEMVKVMQNNMTTEKRKADMQREVDKFEALQRQEAEVLTGMTHLVRDWAQLVIPDSKIIVSTFEAGNVNARYLQGVESMEAVNLGRHWSLSDGTLFLEVNPRAHEFAGVIDQEVMLETVSHEFGHAVIGDTLENLPVAHRKALMNAHKKWLNTMDLDSQFSKTFYQLTKPPLFMDTFRTESRKGVFAGKSVRDGLGLLEMARPGQVDYLLSLNEFTANQTAKWIIEGKNLGLELQPAATALNKRLKEFHRKFSSDWGGSEGYKTFLEHLAAKAEFDTLRKQLRLEERVQNQKTPEVFAADQLDIVVQKSGLSVQELKDSGLENLHGDIVRYGKIIKYGTTLLQLGDLNPNLAPLQNYIQETKAWWATKMHWANRADEKLRLWPGSFSKKKREGFSQFLHAVTQKSFAVGRKLTEEETEAFVREFDISEDEFSFYDLLLEDFQAAIEAVREVRVNNAHSQFIDNPLALRSALTEISREFDELANRDFFPLSRFGNFSVMIKAKRPLTFQGKQFDTGQTVTFEMFETERQAKKAWRKHKKVYGDQVSMTAISDQIKPYIGMPTQFYSSLEDKLELTPEQFAELQELKHVLAPGASWAKHMLKRKGTLGFSLDAKRGYANYFMHFSSHLSRLQHSQRMEDTIRELGHQARELQTKGGDAVKTVQIADHLQRHFDYLMNPGNELANLRALGFLWYLGFSVKSAVVNLTQVPLVTYPYLAARYGDLGAVKELTKAYKDASMYWAKPETLTSDEHAMLDELKESGIIDESLATELAGASEGSVLQRLAPGRFAGSEAVARWIRHGADWGAWMFQSAEKVNRRVTALAAYRLGLQRTQGHTAATAGAKAAVESTQYEYARFNRPRFMQGKKSAFFLFWQYMQNTVYFSLRDPGRSRFYLMLFALAGLSGLPFAEDMLNLFDYVATKSKKILGMKEPKTEARLWIRNFVKELGASPDLIMHGLSRSTFGMAQVGEMLGIPIPGVDISGSLSMGRVIPGMETLTATEGSFKSNFVQGATEAGGAMVAIPVAMMQALSDDNPDTWKRLERTAPTALKGLSKAVRLGVREEETLPSGANLADFDWENALQRAELVAQALNFPTTRVNVEREKQFISREIVAYYEMRRRMLMDDFDFMKRSGDEGGAAAALEIIRKYNNTVPDARMKISLKSLSRSRSRRERRRASEERGVGASRQTRKTFEAVSEAFPSTR